MFQARIAAGSEIHLHELLYPVLQGYDSCELESDLTIVGTDQLFNELMGRFLADRLGAAPQVVITTHITPGTDGRAKQSKSLGNYIALSDSARDMFGKAMKLPDRLVAEYLRHYTLVPLPEVEALEHAMAAGEVNPMQAKRVLGRALVERYHSAAAADAEDEWFGRVFSGRSVPDDVPVVPVADPNVTLLELLRQCLPGESLSALPAAHRRRRGPARRRARADRSGPAPPGVQRRRDQGRQAPVVPDHVRALVVVPRHLRAARADQEIEVGALVRLLHVLHVQPRVAAL